MGSSTTPLVLYVFVKSSVQDTRQRVYENVNDVAKNFHGVEFRVFRLDADAVYDDMLDLFLRRLSQSDVDCLHGVIINGYGQNPTGALGDTELSGAYFKMILLAMLRRRSHSATPPIAVVCAQSFSHMFTQQADSVPAKSSSAFQFIPLTTSYQPYQVKTDTMPTPTGFSGRFDFCKLVGQVLQPPNAKFFQRHGETMHNMSAIVRSDHF